MIKDNFSRDNSLSYPLTTSGPSLKSTGFLFSSVHDRIRAVVSSTSLAVVKSFFGTSRNSA